jgi:hypothetical protein
MMSRRFVMKLSTNDIHMLVVPPWFQHALREWIKIALPHSVPLSACRLCDEWVQVTDHGGQVVFGGTRRIRSTSMICITATSWSSSSRPSP